MRIIRTKYHFVYGLVLLSMLIIPLASNGQNNWDLKTCIQYAMDNNLQIKQKRLQNEAAALDVKQSTWAFAPSLEESSSLNLNWAGNDNNRNLSNNYSINTQVPLFAGFQQWHQYHKSKIDKDISLLQSEIMEKDIALNITGFYLNILYSKEMLAVAQQQLALSQLQIARTKQLVEAGTLPQGSLLEIESQAATEATNVVNAQNQLSMAYLNLKQLLEIDADTYFEIDTVFDADMYEAQVQTPTTVYNKALGLMPEIQAAELGILSAQKSVQIAKGALWPTLSLSGGLQTAYYDNSQAMATSATQPDFWQQIDDNTGKFVGVSLRMPIFYGFTAQNRVKKAQINSLHQQYALDLQKNSLRKIIEKQYQDAIAALKTYEAGRKSVEALERAFEYSQERFNVGLINPVDYNVAKVKLTQAQSQLLRAKYDYIFKNKILDFYTGVPLSL